MRTLCAFIKKEWMEQIRSGKFLILIIVFGLFGVMNPAIAKLTPWLMDMLSETMAESGMTVTAVEVDAMTSWVQFFKNIPMGLIVFVLMQAGIFTKEYQSGTLVLSLTKGLRRRNVVLAKSIVLMVLWSVYYWLSYGITYGYNTYFWDNSIAKHLSFSVLCWWVFGLWIIAFIVFFSTLSKASSGVLLGVGAMVMVSYFLSLIPKLGKYLPTLLLDGNSLIYGAKEPADYMVALIIVIITGIFGIGISIPILNKKNI